MSRYLIGLELIADNDDLSTKQLTQLSNAIAGKANETLGDLLNAIGGPDSYLRSARRATRAHQVDY